MNEAQINTVFNSAPIAICLYDSNGIIKFSNSKFKDTISEKLECELGAIFYPKTAAKITAAQNFTYLSIDVPSTSNQKLYGIIVEIEHSSINSLNALFLSENPAEDSLQVQFIKALAHDIKTPLAIISGHIELLQELISETTLTETQRECLDNIKLASAQAIELVNKNYREKVISED